MPLTYASDKIVAVQKRSDEMAILNILANFHQKSEAVLRKFNRKAPVLVCFILKKTPTTEVFSSGLCKMFKNGFSCITPLAAASEKFHNEVLFTLDLRTTAHHLHS